MDDKTRAEIRQTIAQELRTLGFLDIPADRLPPLPIDDETERQAIALIREGVDIEVDDVVFGRTMHRLVFIAMRACREHDAEPTIERVLALISCDGWDAEHVRESVTELLDEVPIRSTPTGARLRLEHVHRCRECARLANKLSYLYRDPSAWDTASDTLQALIRLGGA